MEISLKLAQLVEISIVLKRIGNAKSANEIDIGEHNEYTKRHIQRLPKGS